jgi:hypothetical protein
LLDRGYSADQIHLILGGNLMRVLRAAEQAAERGSIIGEQAK